jgi:hypothetical protein
MTSLQNSIKQIPADGGYFVALATLADKVYQYDETAKTFTFATWASTNGTGTDGAGVSLINAIGKVVKDMGKTVVSSTRTFRKVQAMLVPSDSTFGVAGPLATNENYFTGYIELGFEGSGTPAPVAQFGR